MAFLNPENHLDRILIYWQTEDLLRAYGLEVNKLLESKAFGQELDDNDTKDWLMELAVAMKKEQVQEIGHTSHSLKVIKQLEAAHLIKLDQSDYKTEFEILKPAIKAYKLQKPIHLGDVYIMVEILYAFYLKKMSGDEISTKIEELGMQAATCLNALIDG